VGLFSNLEGQIEGFMATITILGAGVMGSAFTFPLADKGHTVHLVGTHLDTKIIQSLKTKGCHLGLNVKLPERVIPFEYLELSEAVKNTDLIVLGVSSVGIPWAAAQLGQALKSSLPVLALTKGLAVSNHTLEILPRVFKSLLPEHLQTTKLLAIMGPCIAAELAIRRHTSVMLSGEDESLLAAVAALLRTSYYHVWTSTDFVGTETCAAFKNVYALLVGMAKGILEHEDQADSANQISANQISANIHNLSSSLFAQALHEMEHLVQCVGGDAQSVYSLPGAGDLYVTCQSGRNGRMGRWLGKGLMFSEAKAKHMPDDTIEGAELAKALKPTLRQLLSERKLHKEKVPLLELALAVICEDAPADIPWDKFFA
jgi:glycerol-3-phosphate dehydrogenase (NAD(P)+)